MRHCFWFFLPLSVIAAVLGFGILSGTAAVIFEMLFVGLFVVSMFALIRGKKIRRSSRGSFASSFQSEV